MGRKKALSQRALWNLCLLKVNAVPRKWIFTLQILVYMTHSANVLVLSINPIAVRGK